MLQGKGLTLHLYEDLSEITTDHKRYNLTTVDIHSSEKLWTPGCIGTLLEIYNANHRENLDGNIWRRRSLKAFEDNQKFANLPCDKHLLHDNRQKRVKIHKKKKRGKKTLLDYDGPNLMNKAENSEYQDSLKTLSRIKRSGSRTDTRRLSNYKSDYVKELANSFPQSFNNSAITDELLPEVESLTKMKLQNEAPPHIIRRNLPSTKGNAGADCRITQPTETYDSGRSRRYDDVNSVTIDSAEDSVELIRRKRDDRANNYELKSALKGEMKFSYPKDDHVRSATSARSIGGRMDFADFRLRDDEKMAEVFSDHEALSNINAPEVSHNIEGRGILTVDDSSAIPRRGRKREQKNIRREKHRHKKKNQKKRVGKKQKPRKIINTGISKKRNSRIIGKSKSAYNGKSNKNRRDTKDFYENNHVSSVTKRHVNIVPPVIDESSVPQALVKNDANQIKLQSNALSKHEEEGDSIQSFIKDVKSRTKRDKDTDSDEVYRNSAEDELRYYESIREPEEPSVLCVNHDENPTTESNLNRDDRAASSIEEVKGLAEKLVAKVNELRSYLSNDDTKNSEEKQEKKVQVRAIDDLCSNVSTACTVLGETPKPVQRCASSSTTSIERTSTMKTIVERKVDLEELNDDLKRHGAEKKRLFEEKRGLHKGGSKTSSAISRRRDVKKPRHKWGRWTDWSSCSVTCGKGRQIRWRYCLEDCTTAETEMEEKACQLPACPPTKFLGIF